MGIGRRTADRYWAYARAWLCDALSNVTEDVIREQSPFPALSRNVASTLL